MWQVATATGWTFRHIMWEINYQTLIMAVSDQIRYKTKEETSEPEASGVPRGDSDADNSALAFFQSQANE